jgi:riboflavin kinase/FMN adenylyltransferase
LSRRDIDSIAIGKFDSFHLGHQALFKDISENGAILVIDRKYEDYLLPPKYRDRFIDFPIFSYNLEDIFSLSGEDFIDKLSEDFPNLSHIVVGYDFRFGKGREQSAEDLQNLFSKTVTVVDEVKIDSISVHSAEIRKRVLNGEMDVANRLLGRNYSIIGEHFRDRGVGSRELFPTINVSYFQFTSPKSGVYASKTKLEGEIYDSISFIGNRTSTDKNFALETHILDKKLPDREFGEVEIEFLEYIRENREFGNLKELKNQIEKDIERAKEL